MMRFSSARSAGFAGFLLMILCFTQSAEAQKTLSKKLNVFKKIVHKGGEKKPDAVSIAASEAKVTPKGRLPVIIIPGLIGSELVNKMTDEKVWFNLLRSKEDDLRLPISPDLKANRDNLVPRDILRKIQLIRLTPEIGVYQKLIEVLQADSYTEGKIDAPAESGFTDTFYVFPYDWRLDNVGNAQLLLQKMDEIRTRTKRPELKFNIVAHSMGGLIARYAALYGSADLTTGSAPPAWKGAPYINSISLVATPNAGALGALNSFINGFSLFGGGKLNFPFVQKFTKYDVFTIPSIYQLLPHDGTVRAFDENLKPLKIDIYDPATWEKYGWAAYTDEAFVKNFDAADQAQAKAYFQAVLLRAKLFQAALDAKPATKSPFPTYYLGSECKQTVDGMIIRRDAKSSRWITDFGSSAFTRSDGTKVTAAQTAKVLLSPGDGVVAKRSLLASFLDIGGRLRNPRSGILINDTAISCDEHNRLTGNEGVDKNLLTILNNPVNNPSKPITKKAPITRRKIVRRRVRVN